MKHPPVKVRLILLALAALLGWAAWSLTHRNDPLHGTLMVSGTVEADEADLAPRVAGRLVQLDVDEGSRVRKGQRIARLDAPELDARAAQAKANLAAAEARLLDVERGSRAERIREAMADLDRAVAAASGAVDVNRTLQEAHARSNELQAQYSGARANTRAAEQELRAAEARWRMVTTGPRREELDRLQASVTQADALWQGADREYRRLARLLDQGAVSQQQVDNALTACDAAKAALEAARTRLAEAQAGARSEERDEVAARVAQARERLLGAREVEQATLRSLKDRTEALQRAQTAQMNARTAGAGVRAAQARVDLLKNGATEAERDALRAQVRTAQAQLDEALSARDQLTLYAPYDGVVTVRYRDVGEAVSPAAPVVRICGNRRRWVRVYAPLPSLGRLFVGQTVDVFVDSRPDKPFTGRVATISEEAEFTPRSVQTAQERVKLVYAVRVDVLDAGDWLKPGMPADVRLTVQSTR